jgi:hypothetical protein
VSVSKSAVVTSKNTPAPAVESIPVLEKETQVTEDKKKEIIAESPAPIS